jgi:hypothetical protein
MAVALAPVSAVVLAPPALVPAWVLKSVSKWALE